MRGFVQGADRQQATLLPECLDDWVDEGNPVRAVDVFVDALELRDLGFDGVDPTATGRPGYHPSALLKLYIYGYLNRVQSSRRLEREAGRNLEVIWLLGRLVPDDKTDSAIATATASSPDSVMKPMTLSSSTSRHSSPLRPLASPASRWHRLLSGPSRPPNLGSVLRDHRPTDTPE